MASRLISTRGLRGCKHSSFPLPSPRHTEFLSQGHSPCRVSRPRGTPQASLRARGSPVAVVGELIVTGEGDEHPKAHTQREAYLDGCVNPDLQEWRDRVSGPTGRGPRGETERGEQVLRGDGAG